MTQDDLQPTQSATIDFFFFYGSIHTYLSAMRIGTLATQAGVQIRWCPFNLRAILIEQNNTSFTKNTIRLAYNWGDIERRAARLGIPFNGRAPYPVEADLLALRVGTLAAAEGWCADYTRATFAAWFLAHQPAGAPSSVAKVLMHFGKDPARLIAQAGSAEVTERLNQETDTARQLGIFGSPTFSVGRELFWGDDRLEEAIEQASNGHDGRPLVMT